MNKNTILMSRILQAINFKIFYLAFIALFCSGINYSYSQNLVKGMAIGSGSTKSDLFSTVTGSSVTIDVTGINEVLVISSFESQMASNGADVREATYRLVDESDPDNFNSGNIRRSLSIAHGVDYRLGSLVNIFDVSPFSGDRTFSLQHTFNTTARTLTTNATTIAIGLNDGFDDLKSVSRRVSVPDTMTTTWEGVVGSETDVINTTHIGGFYVAASLQVKPEYFNTEAEAQWKLQYKKGISGSWTDISPAVRRSFIDVLDIGVVGLVGHLPDESTPGDYYFRVAHRRTSATSEIKTEAVNLVVVSLGNESGVFTIINGNENVVSTISPILSDVKSIPFTPGVNTDLFISSQFSMNAITEIDTAIYDLYVDNSIFDGLNQRRYVGVNYNVTGLSIGLGNNLIEGTTYNISLRHASTTGNTLNTNDLSIVGFGLSPISIPLPIELLSFNAECRQDGKVELTWITATEKNNDYFIIFRSIDSENWEEISYVNGSENSNSILTYQYVDEMPNHDNTYYKLKQTDSDGNSEEFDIVVVYCKFDNKKIELNPNPANNYLILSYYNEYHIEKPLIVYIYNSRGERCFMQYLYPEREYNQHMILLPSNLQPGIYYVHVLLGGEYFYNDKIIKK